MPGGAKDDRRWHAGDATLSIDSALGLRPEREAEIVDELTQHLEDRVRELSRAGTDSAAAMVTALADLDARGELARRLAEIEARPG